MIGILIYVYGDFQFFLQKIDKPPKIAIVLMIKVKNEQKIWN